MKILAYILKSSEFIGKSCYIMYLLAFVIILSEVAMRYVFNSPSEWAYEVSLTLCAISWVLSVGYVGTQERHISITFLRESISKKKADKLNILTSSITAFGFFSLAISTYGAMIDSILTLERTGSSFNPPMPAILKTTLFLGAVIGCIQTIALTLVKLNSKEKKRQGVKN